MNKLNDEKLSKTDICATVVVTWIAMGSLTMIAMHLHEWVKAAGL